MIAVSLSGIDDEAFSSQRKVLQKRVLAHESSKSSSQQACEVARHADASLYAAWDPSTE